MKQFRAPNRPRRRPPPSAHRRLVLYVEDERDNWEVTRLALERRFRLVWAQNDRQACGLVRAHGHELTAILMDIELKGSELDGIELTKLLRGQLPEDRIPSYGRKVEPVDAPVLFVTAYGASYPEEELRAVGGSHLISKPVDYGALPIALTRGELASPAPDLSKGRTLLQASSPGSGEVPGGTLEVPEPAHDTPFGVPLGALLGETEAPEPERWAALVAGMLTDAHRVPGSGPLLGAAFRRAAAAHLLVEACGAGKGVRDGAAVLGFCLELGSLARAHYDLEGALEVMSCPAAIRPVRE